MKGIQNINVVIAESSAIIRFGILSIIKRLPNFNIQATEILSMEALHHAIKNHEVDVVIINPTFGGWFNLAEFKSLYPQSTARYAAVLSNMSDTSMLHDYDFIVELYDSMETLNNTFTRLLDLEDDDSENEQEALSIREKEIICYVVKGLTNKEIAEKLYISVQITASMIWQVANMAIRL